MVLVDSSVWIDFFNHRSNPQTDFLETLVNQEKDLCVCGIIYSELLQGIRDDAQCKHVQAVLDNLIYFEHSKPLFLQAAHLYRRLRKTGITIRNPVDCQIAAVCLQHGLSLLHNDRDFDQIAKYFPLKISGRHLAG
jgi:predicted nucleic acid-binding protein